MEATLIFPHQLYELHPALALHRKVFLLEEFLFFKQYVFHQQKIVFHRATMKFYEAFLREKNYQVVYLESANNLSYIRNLIPHLQREGFSEIHFAEVADNWLEKRIENSTEANGIRCKAYDSPGFFNTNDEIKNYFLPGKHYSQTSFYIQQRKKLGLLIDVERKPLGGKWTFDLENRKKYPSGKIPPKIDFPHQNRFLQEAICYVGINFSQNYGHIGDKWIYPTTFSESKDWFRQFLEYRFAEFGPYEDAIVANESILHHSLLSPLLNTGLLTPADMVQQTLDFAGCHAVPLSSTEGFLRQMIGWREFIRGVYVTSGSKQRTRNYWKFKRKMPASFWRGETGIKPLDVTVKKILQTGYCHHIERLMVLGNFMLLCEFDPDEVYKWFMELFVDAYDWVMVPNVYGMSQFADGGLMATKPYISSSNYLMKMSDYPKGEWQQIWDGLFWRFMNIHRDFFLSNPRLSMLLKTFDAMDESKKQMHLTTAESFLSCPSFV